MNPGQLMNAKLTRPTAEMLPLPDWVPHGLAELCNVSLCPMVVTSLSQRNDTLHAPSLPVVVFSTPSPTLSHPLSRAPTNQTLANH